MTFQEYTDICIDFAKNAKTWQNLNLGKSYVTEGTNGWFESEDIDTVKGLDVSWAFHLSEKSIRQYAPQVYWDWIDRKIDDALSNYCDVNMEEQLNYIHQVMRS